MDFGKKRNYKYIVGIVLLALVGYLLIAKPELAAEIAATLNAILAPLIIGGSVALVLNVFVSAMEGVLQKIDRKSRLKPKLRTVLSVLFVLIAIIVVFSLIVSIIVPRIGESVRTISQLFNDHKDEILEYAEQVGLDTAKISEKLSELDLNNILEKVTNNISNIVSTLVGTVSTLFGGVFVGVISLVCCIYLLSDKRKLGRNCKTVLYAYVKTSTADKICEVLSLFNVTFKRFLSCQCLEAVILGALLFVAMLIFRLPYALVIASLTTVCALIPYVGAFVSCGVGAFFILMIDPMKALIFIVVFLVVQQIEGNVIYPRVVGNSIGLPALWTLLAVYIGGELFGIAGMLFFIPVVSVLYTLLKQDSAKRLKDKQLTIE